MRRRITRLRDLVPRVKRSLCCSNGECVAKLTCGNIVIRIRDSKNTGGAVVRFTPEEWHTFLSKASNGGFDGVAPDENNRYAFLKWVLEDSKRTLRLALLLAVAVATVVLAPHLLTPFL
jgi:hypothetical protein